MRSLRIVVQPSLIRAHTPTHTSAVPALPILTTSRRNRTLRALQLRISNLRLIRMRWLKRSTKAKVHWRWLTLISTAKAWQSARATSWHSIKIIQPKQQRLALTLWLRVQLLPLIITRTTAKATKSMLMERKLIILLQLQKIHCSRWAVLRV